MDSFYLTLSSDSSKIFFNNNTIAHFSTQLAQPITLSSGDWEVALCEVFIPSCRLCDDGESKTPIFLYTDIIRPQFVGDTMTRLLRVLPPNIASDHQIFSSLYYIPIEKVHFASITISFCSKTGKRYPFPASEHPSIVVLHFRRVYKIL